MWAAAALSEANHLPEIFHVLNHFHKFNAHLRILLSVLLIEMFELRLKEQKYQKEVLQNRPVTSLVH